MIQSPDGRKDVEYRQLTCKLENGDEQFSTALVLRGVARQNPFGSLPRFHRCLCGRSAGGPAGLCEVAIEEVEHIDPMEEFTLSVQRRR